MTDELLDPVHGKEITVNPYTRNKKNYKWDWRAARGEEHYRTCNYCGSINPEDLAKETVVRADWSDMKYGWPHKIYIDLRNPDPKKLYVVMASSNGEPPTVNPTLDERDQTIYVKREDLTREHKKILKRDGWEDSLKRDAYAYYGFGYRKALNVKFYSVHLADPTISEEVRDKIHRMMGLVFTWTPDGHVSWKRYPLDLPSSYKIVDSES